MLQQKKGKRILLSVAIVALIILGLCGYRALATAKPAEEVKPIAIGVLYPFGLQGPGGDNCALLAAEEINEAGGVKVGKSGGQLR